MEIFGFDLSNFWDILQDIFKNNQFFQGAGLAAAITAVITGAFMYLRQIPFKLWRIFDRYTTMYLEVSYGSENFTWLSQHCGKLFEDSCFGEFLVVDARYKKNLFDDEEEVEEPKDSGIISQTKTVPSGYRWTRNKLCWIRYDLEKRDLDNARGTEAVTYTLRLKLFGFRKRQTLEEILNKSKEIYGPSAKRLKVCRAQYDYWEGFCDLAKRKKETIFCDHLDEILEDVDEFLSSRSDYVDKGIPYHRGIGLFGTSGTGKSTIAQYIARHTERDLCVVSLSTASGLQLNNLLSKSGKLILFEDIDAASNSVMARTETVGTKSNSDNNQVSLLDTLSLSDILNALDGATTGEDNIFVFTSNHPEKLDPALLRAGRVDKRVDFSYVSNTEFEKMCECYYREKPPEGFKLKQLVHSECMGFYQSNRKCFQSFLRLTLK